MKLLKSLLIVLLCALVFAVPAWWYSDAGREEHDPDMPAGVKADKAAYLAARDEQIAFIRGIDTASAGARGRAISEMEESERQLAERGNQLRGGAWRPLGPAPIPNGITIGRIDPASGRTSAIAVDPTNHDMVYSGAAQGGLYRSMDGGITWTPMLDNALSLAIGAVTVAPSDPSVVYVGTGESGFSLDSFLGVGIYRIDGANTLNPTVTGPLNKNAAGSDIFSGRGIGRIFVHPSDPGLIYVSSVTGSAGISGSTAGFPLPPRGLYRSYNANTANPVFEQLTVSFAVGDRPTLDIAVEPGNPDRMFVSIVDTTGHGDGGVYFSKNATAQFPEFTRLFATASGPARAEFAIQRSGNAVTVYVAHATSGGLLSKAVYDSHEPGNPEFSVLPGGQGFCTPQCGYDIAVGVDPHDADLVYLAGSPAMPFAYSTDGGQSFTDSVEGLHVDTHVITPAPSRPETLYFGSDGGIWRSDNRGIDWTSMNTETYSATQFESVAVHPNERHYTLGGTQDNGTEFLYPDGVTWKRAVGGDGGMVVFDSNSESATSQTNYHTFFNRTNTLIGFSRSTQTLEDGTPIYDAFLGCGGIPNGISCSDATVFYAPLVLGPNTEESGGKNTVYFGTNKLYRSIDQGTTMEIVSQTLPAGGNQRVSAIAVSAQNDAARLIGSTTGRVYYSNQRGAKVMTDITGAIPPRYVGRIAFSPADERTAYVALNGYGIPGQHVMKTSDLGSPSPTWVNAGEGIPDVPTNSVIVDPADPNVLFAGTDIGVFRSTNAGESWEPFSNGLPRVAVFQVTISPRFRVLKIATHGRGIWEYDLNTDRRAAADFDGDGRSDLAVWRGSNGIWYRQTSSNGQTSADQFGLPGDRIVPGDYDGDRRTDLGIYRPSQGVWYLQQSSGGLKTVQFGVADDLPAPADYDGDGKTDIAVFRPSSGQWWIDRSTAGATVIQFGIAGDKPVQADYDGDGLADIAVFRPSNGVWYTQGSASGFTVTQYGADGDKVVPADYDGDLRADKAVYRGGVWYILRSTGAEIVLQYGLADDIPSPGDYDGDGRADLCVFRPSSGIWFRINSTTSQQTIFQYGLNGDTPVESAYVPVQ